MKTNETKPWVMSTTTTLVMPAPNYTTPALLQPTYNKYIIQDVEMETKHTHTLSDMKNIDIERPPDYTSHEHLHNPTQGSTEVSVFGVPSGGTWILLARTHTVIH